MKIRVLLVDDNINMVNELKQYFSSSEVVEVVAEAYDGIEAYEKISSNNYDLVVMDVLLPKKDGLSVIEQAKKDGCKSKFIVISGYNSLDVVKRASDCGVNYYMLKPFVYEDLENHIVKVMEFVTDSLQVKDTDLEKTITSLLHS